MRTFLTARWANLGLFQFAVPDEVLLPHLPDGLELDRIADGKAFVSLVAFDFENVRVFGIPWPLHTRFPELNLRFYVKGGGRRGVVFIKELVPRPAVAFIARWVYNEPYAIAPMKSRVTRTEERVTFTHQIRYGGRKHFLQVTGEPGLLTEPEDSQAHQFKEHSWGFGRGTDGRTSVYQVEHPVWRTYPVKNYLLDLDPSLLYGPEWAFLKDQEPHSVVMAEGSAISVFMHGKLA